MVSTITVSTISVIATTTLAIQSGIIATVFLIAFLILKNVLDASPDKKNLTKWLYIGITPLLINFVIIVGLKIMEILG
jgi:hypothetical protein